jgi:glycine cleavage system pyridoxal-binding protein P
MNYFEQQQNEFSFRHIGTLNEKDRTAMLSAMGLTSVEELIDKTVPASIRLKKPLKIPAAESEYQYLKELKKLLQRIKFFNPILDKVITIPSRPALYLGMFLKTQDGILNTRLIKQKFRKVD